MLSTSVSEPSNTRHQSEVPSYQRRIAKVFSDLKNHHKKALIPFITAGDPNLATSLQLMHALVRAGADIIELGVPFSDPMADGPTIQRASERALAQGVNLSQVFDLVEEFRKINKFTPIVLMGYANPLERMGIDRFVLRAAAVGVDGVLVVDYPPEEAYSFAQAMQAHSIDPIFLLAPTSTHTRIQAIAALASGYVYYVSLKGVTGAGTLNTEEVAQRVQLIKQSIAIPVGVGFGIRDASSACAVARTADAVVIGSALIELIEKNTPDTAPEQAGSWLSNIRHALDTMD